MKLKKILSNIKEKWYAGTENSLSDRDYREIFVNPSPVDISDIQEFGGSFNDSGVRFIAIKESKNVYVSAGDVFHIDLVKEIDELGGNHVDNIIENFSGTGNIIISEISVAGFSDYIEDYPDYAYELCRDILDGEYDWMERYNFDLSNIKYVAEDDIDLYKNAEMPY